MTAKIYSFEIDIDGEGNSDKIESAIYNFIEKLGFKFLVCDPDIPPVKVGYSMVQEVLAYYKKDDKLYKLHGRIKTYPLAESYSIHMELDEVTSDELEEGEKEWLLDKADDYFPEEKEWLKKIL